MALSNTAIRAAKPANRPYKLFDGGGLYLIVRPTGAKLWRLKYRYLGKEQALVLGQYPDVGLKQARADRDKARKLIASGKNPSLEKKRAAVAASRAWSSDENSVSFKNLSRSRPLKLSMKVFLVGLPGAM